jgi:hypothetical protein
MVWRCAAQLAGGPPVADSVIKIEQLIRDIEAETETGTPGDSS